MPSQTSPNFPARTMTAFYAAIASRCMARRLGGLEQYLRDKQKCDFIME